MYVATRSEWPEGGRIALFDGRHRRAHKSLEKGLNVVVEFAIFVSDRRLRSEREREPHRTRLKRLHMFRDIFVAAQSRGGIALGIDQLQDAQHFTFRVAHRQCQERPRAISRFAVVVVVEVKW